MKNKIKILAFGFTMVAAISLAFVLNVAQADTNSQSSFSPLFISGNTNIIPKSPAWIVGNSSTNARFKNSTSTNMWITGQAGVGCVQFDTTGKLVNTGVACGTGGGGGGSGVGWTWNGVNLLRQSTTTDDVVLGANSTSSLAKLEVHGNIYDFGNLIISGYASSSYFVATSTATSTFTGGISTNLLSVNSSTASSTFANGINLTKGCFAVNGVCVTGGGSMVYPASGIALSTGSAWGTSIADNSANWNTAYGWGNHASAGYFPTVNFGTYFYNYFSATNTSALAEGNNLYWTNTRFDNRLSGTTTLPNITTLANLSTVGTITSGTWHGSAIEDSYFTKTGNWTGTFDGQEGTYYLNAGNLTNFGTPFYNFFHATNTDALSQGSTNLYNQTHTGDVTGSTVLTIGAGKVLDSMLNTGTGATQINTADIPELTNLYYTDARVNTYVNASTTIPKTYTSNTFVPLQIFGNASTTLLSVAGNTIPPNYYLSVTWPQGGATTTTATTTVPLASAGQNETWTFSGCRTTSGTSAYEYSDGTNKMNYILASTTVSTYALTTNNSYAKEENRMINVGPLTAAQITCTITKNY